MQRLQMAWVERTQCIQKIIESAEPVLPMFCGFWVVGVRVEV